MYFARFTLHEEYYPPVCLHTQAVDRIRVFLDFLRKMNPPITNRGGSHVMAWNLTGGLFR